MDTGKTGATAAGQGHQRGFTLVESLVTLLIVSVGISALAGFQAHLWQASSQVRARAEAVWLLQATLESFRHIVTRDAFVPHEDGFPHSGAHADYEVRWTIVQDNLAGSFRVTVEAEWREREVVQRLSLYTLLANTSPAERGRILAEPGPP